MLPWNWADAFKMVGVGSLCRDPLGENTLGGSNDDAYYPFRLESVE